METTGHVLLFCCGKRVPRGRGGGRENQDLKFEISEGGHSRFDATATPWHPHPAEGKPSAASPGNFTGYRETGGGEGERGGGCVWGWGVGDLVGLVKLFTSGRCVWLADS